MAMSMLLRRRNGCARSVPRASAPDPLLWMPEGSHRRCPASSRDDGDSDVRVMAGHDCAVRESAPSELCTVRRARRGCLRALARVIRGVRRGHGRASAWNNARSHQPRRELRARQLSVGDHGRAARQPAMLGAPHARWSHPDAEGVGARTRHQLLQALQPPAQGTACRGGSPRHHIRGVAQRMRSQGSAS